MLPPQNLEAEMGVLGSVLLLQDVIDECADLRTEHFYADRNQRIWDVIQEMYRSQIRLDAVTVAEKLESKKWLSEVGGVEYLAKVLETVPNASHAKYYANIVISKWRSRQAVYGARDILADVEHGADDQEIAAKAEGVLSDIAERATQHTACDIKDVMLTAWAKIETRFKNEKPDAMATGWTDLDELIVGFAPTDLIIVGARPSMGKSAFASCLALSVANRNIPVLVASLEMSQLELAERLLSADGNVDAMDLRRGQWSGDDITVERKRDDLLRAAGRISALPLEMDDSPQQNMRHIAATARRMKRKRGLGMLIIDYLQFIEPDRTAQNREQEVAQSSKACKNLAKELEVPVVLLCQLNRDVEKRASKIPQLSDLRESGAIEQDANLVLFLHRPDAYDPEDRRGEADIIVAKNRNGRCGKVTLAWKAETTQFLDLAPTPWFAGGDGFKAKASRNGFGDRDV